MLPQTASMPGCCAAEELACRPEAGFNIPTLALPGLRAAACLAAAWPSAVAYHDVCQDDAVRLIMESLVALDRTANNIFSAIEDRVSPPARRPRRRALPRRRCLAA